MSTYWGYECQTCGDQSSCWLNHGDRDLRDILLVWPQIRALLDALDRCQTDRIEVRICGGYEGPDIVDWLSHHEGHKLVLRNEYGDTEPLTDTPASGGG